MADSAGTTLFDADNHYWETKDAFTRHRDPRFAERGLQVKEIEGVLRYVIEGEVFQGLPGPADSHPRPSPGAFLGLFQGRTSQKEFTGAFEVAPSEHPEWYNRDKRLAVMDEQGLEACWMFPSQGVVLEAAILQKDIEAAIGIYRAFNRWLDDDWGFAYENRIFAVPYLNLSDPEKAVDELQWCLERDARIVTLRHGPVITSDGLRSPAHPMFDRFWGLAQEAGVVVAPHAGSETTYLEVSALLGRLWGDVPSGSGPSRESMRGFGSGSPVGPLMKGRLIHDFCYFLVAHRLFERFPRLRMAMIENGAAWVPPLLQALEYLDHGGQYEVNPRDQFAEHVSVAPFVEEDVDELARHFPVERILFGSDWPHGEGYPEPKAFLENVANFSPEDQRLIMHDNAHKLTFAR
jgi:predicted TIM-barrel fold metal-dependent hydrolase